LRERAQTCFCYAARTQMSSVVITERDARLSNARVPRALKFWRFQVAFQIR
jgi:hypothetical protein